MPRNLFTLRRARTARPCVSTLCIALLPVALYGCGGGGGGSHPTPVIPVSVSVDAKSASVVVNGTQTFSATVAHAANIAVTWSVEEGAAGGSITSAGVYTAPAAPGTYHVVVTSQQDPAKTAVITVIVTPAVSLSLSPAPVVVRQGRTQSFSVAVQNAANTGVTWSVQEGAAGGSITSAGVYTAPYTAGTYHVVATSRQDPTKNSVAVVTVPVNVNVLPAFATLSVRQSLIFTAQVAGSGNQGVVWSVQEAGGGTITASGVYTAPSVAGIYHVLATSVLDPTQSGLSAVTVQSSSATGTIQ